MARVDPSAALIHKMTARYVPRVAAAFEERRRRGIAWPLQDDLRCRPLLLSLVACRGHRVQQAPVVEQLRSGPAHGRFVRGDHLRIATGCQHTLNATRRGEVEVVAVPRDAVRIAPCAHQRGGPAAQIEPLDRAVAEVEVGDGLAVWQKNQIHWHRCQVRRSAAVQLPRFEIVQGADIDVTVGDIGHARAIRRNGYGRADIDRA